MYVVSATTTYAIANVAFGVNYCKDRKAAGNFSNERATNTVCPLITAENARW
jgi:hypothetical protein